MYGQFVVGFIVFVCLQLSNADMLTADDNILCKPSPKVVPVEENGLPYFVKLYRCQGNVAHSDPSTKQCVVKEQHDVKVEITHGSSQEIKILKNHTSCKGECVNTCSSKWSTMDENCHCTCNLAEAPEGCPSNHIWDDETCNCRCNLENAVESWQKVDSAECKLVCASSRPCPPGEKRHIDSRCSCKPDPAAVKRSKGTDKSHQGTLLAALVVGEFVFLYLIFDSLLYSKKTGLIYKIKEKCQRKPAEEPNENHQLENKPCMENKDDANSTPIEVRVDRNGTSHVATNQHT